jgi:hypothetical protein
MRKGFLITNTTSGFLTLISIFWLVYDFIVFRHLRIKMLQLEQIIPSDERHAILIWTGLLVFLMTHIMAFIAIAAQFHFFKRASMLRIATLIVAIVSCFFIINDIACLSDIWKEYAEGFEVETEWNWLYYSSLFHGLFLILMIANLIESFRLQRSSKSEISMMKDEVIFTLVHGAGVLCGGIGITTVFGIYAENRSHPILHITFPYMFVLTLIPYMLLSGYWLIIKLKEKPADWYDEKQFRDISQAGLLTMFLTIPFLAIIYLTNYNDPGPTTILWFPVYLYFVILIFSAGSLFFNWIK